MSFIFDPIYPSLPTLTPKLYSSTFLTPKMPTSILSHLEHQPRISIPKLSTSDFPNHEVNSAKNPKTFHRPSQDPQRTLFALSHKARAKAYCREPVQEKFEASSRILRSCSVTSLVLSSCDVTSAFSAWAAMLVFEVRSRAFCVGSWGHVPC